MNPGTCWHWIIDDPKLRPNEKLVALAIVRHQYNGHAVNPSQARLSKLTGLGLRTVNRAVCAMQAKGYDFIVKSGKGARRANFYRVKQHQTIFFSTAHLSTPHRRITSPLVRHTGVQKSVTSPEKKERTQKQRASIPELRVGTGPTATPNPAAVARYWERQRRESA